MALFGSHNEEIAGGEDAAGLLSTAIGAVSSVHDPSAGSVAIGALHDPQPRVRVAGLITIANVRSPGAVNEVLA